MRLRAIGILAVVGVLLASCGGSTSGSAGPSEGIEVHGDWTIDIYNEDGTLDRHVEFSNDLGPESGLLIGSILTQAETPGLWSIVLRTEPGSEICQSAPQGQLTPAPCVVLEPEDLLQPGPSRFFTLDVGLAKSGSIALAGNVEASLDGAISSVETNLGYCSRSVVAAECQVSTKGGLTASTMTATSIEPVPVLAGQVVQVQVDISFTSG